MFKPLHSLFAAGPATATAADAKYFIQERLRGELKSEQIVCEAVERDTAHIRVGTATLKQEVLLLQPDITAAMERELAYAVRRWRVKIG